VVFFNYSASVLGDGGTTIFILSYLKLPSDNEG